MCIGKTPDVPTVPERQQSKAPTDPIRTRARDDEARRRGMLATILTSAAGTSGSLSTGSGTGSGGKTYLG